MSDKVYYYDHLNQGEASVLGYHPDVRAPDEVVMDREEGAGEADGTRRWVLEMFLEMIFCDEQPMDWRYAGKRGLALLRSFSPGLLAGRELEEASVFAGLAGQGRFPQDSLRLADDEGGLRELVGALLRWVYQEDTGKWMERGAWRLYVLASHYHGRVLVRWEEAKVVSRRGKVDDHGEIKQQGALVPGRFRRMGYADFSEAFGEGVSAGARARWCYRAKQILEGLPQVPGATSQEAREKMRRAAVGNKNRMGKKKI